jgi:hypothetical protein
MTSKEILLNHKWIYERRKNNNRLEKGRIVDFVEIHDEFGYVSDGARSRERRWIIDDDKISIYGDDDKLTCTLTFNKQRDLWEGNWEEYEKCEIELRKKTIKNMTNIKNAKIAVICLAMGEKFRNSLRLSIENKKEYCKQHNYDFILATEDDYDGGRHPVWAKLPVVKKHLNNYDYILFCDADTYICNLNIKIETIIENTMEEKDFLICNEKHYGTANPGINFGMFIVKNTPWCINLMDTIYNQEDFLKHHWREQEAFNSLYNKQQIDIEKIKVLDNLTIFNAFDGMHRYGDFLIHYAGESNLKKLNEKFVLLNETLKLIKEKRNIIKMPFFRIEKFRKILFPPKKNIYFAITKSGSMSMRRWIEKHYSDQYILFEDIKKQEINQPIVFYHMNNLKEEKFKQYLEFKDNDERIKFTCIRDPWERLASGFFYCKDIKTHKHFGENTSSEIKNMSFKEFIMNHKRIIQDNLIQYDGFNHTLRRQVDFPIQDCSIFLILETINEDWKWFCDTMRFDFKPFLLEHSNPDRKHSNYKYLKEWDDEMKECIYEYIKPDIELYELAKRNRKKFKEDWIL